MAVTAGSRSTTRLIDENFLLLRIHWSFTVPLYDAMRFAITCISLCELPTKHSLYLNLGCHWHRTMSWHKNETRCRPSKRLFHPQLKARWAAAICVNSNITNGITNSPKNESNVLNQRALYYDEECPSEILGDSKHDFIQYRIVWKSDRLKRNKCECTPRSHP